MKVIGWKKTLLKTLIKDLDANVVNAWEERSLQKSSRPTTQTRLFGDCHSSYSPISLLREIPSSSCYPKDASVTGC
jgi:hypothetical protein